MFNTRTGLLLGTLLALFQASGHCQQIAITFDDLPSHAALPPGETRVSVIESILAAMRDARVPAIYGFINARRVAEEPATARVLDLWRAAGHPLANHTWSHQRLDDTTVSAWTDDVARNESTLVRLMGDNDWRWLRYPFLNEGNADRRAGARQWLAEHRYRVASVTMSFDDWAYNGPYARCAARGDSAGIAMLEQRWLAAADSALSYYRGLSRSLYGRDIPYVLLMHVGAFDARLLPRLFALYRDRGVGLVTLEEAQTDPFYADDMRSAASPAPATLENALRQRGLPVPARTWRSDDLESVCR